MAYQMSDDEKRESVRSASVTAGGGGKIDLTTADRDALIEYISRLEVNLYNLNHLRTELYDELWKLQNKAS